MNDQWPYPYLGKRLSILCDELLALKWWQFWKRREILIRMELINTLISEKHEST